MTSLQTKEGNWVFITPIEGLELTKAIDEEFLVNRVTFVSSNKLPRIRKRLRIPAPLSELIKIGKKEDKGFEKRMKEFFSSSETYAVLPYKGKPKEKDSECLRIINDELSILSLSQSGWSTRRFNKKIEIKTSDRGVYYRKISINKQKKEFTFGYKTKFSPVPLMLEKPWVDFHRRFFFFELVKIIRGELKVSEKWKAILYRAAIIAGRSQNSNDLSSCFLWNVIVLEMLLIEGNEKISDNLVHRSEYFLGWNEQWSKENYETRIKEIYGKRSEFVHEGTLKQIPIKDLLFTDDLLFNIFNNIIRCRNKIQNRSDIVKYCKKFEAEKLLSLKSKYQFGKFEIFRKHYTEDDFNMI